MTEATKCEVPGGTPGPTFEQALQRLEEVVARLESGELTLDESLALFEEGVKLSRICSARLSEAEQRIEKLIERSDGSVGSEPLTLGERK